MTRQLSERSPSDRRREVGRSADMCSYMLNCLYYCDGWCPDEGMYDGWGRPSATTITAVSRSRRLGLSQRMSEHDFGTLVSMNRTPRPLWRICHARGLEPVCYGHGVFQVRWLSDGAAQMRRIIYCRSNAHLSGPVLPYDVRNALRVYSLWRPMATLSPTGVYPKLTSAPEWEFDLRSFDSDSDPYLTEEEG